MNRIISKWQARIESKFDDGIKWFKAGYGWILGLGIYYYLVNPQFDYLVNIVGIGTETTSMVTGLTFVAYHFVLTIVVFILIHALAAKLMMGRFMRSKTQANNNPQPLIYSLIVVSLILVVTPLIADVIEFVAPIPESPRFY